MSFEGLMDEPSLAPIRNPGKGNAARPNFYQSELLGVYRSLHYLLHALDERWKGLHLLIVALLRKSSPSRSSDARRPDSG